MEGSVSYDLFTAYLEDLRVVGEAFTEIGQATDRFLQCLSSRPDIRPDALRALLAFNKTVEAYAVEALKLVGTK
jgi:hypothetical protein